VLAAAAHAASPSESRYSARIAYTAGGVPHITARGFGGAGYGYGYAAARDNLCVLADDYLTLSGERSRFHGAAASYTSSGAGISVNDLDSDVYYRYLDGSGVIDRALASPAPRGPRPELRKLVDGYVTGYNRYVREAGARTSDPACRGEAWVRPITARLVYLRGLQVAILGSGVYAVHDLANAAPPAAKPRRTADTGRTASLPLDATLRDTRFAEPAGARIPVPGGPSAAGVLNALGGTTGADGTTAVSFGSSYIQAVALAPGRCPDARTVLTYSQSSDPASPHAADQTRWFSGKRPEPDRSPARPSRAGGRSAAPSAARA
jgi:acyl-homoserine-lactone acylase